MKTLKAIPDRLVVLTFDDGCKSDIEVVAPLLKTYGFGATFYVNDHSGAVSGWKSENYTTWSQIRRLHEMGFEIGNHTARHPGVCGLSDEALIAELEQIELRCSENGIDRPTTFCYPGFHFSAAAVKVLRSRGYQFARRGGFPEMPYHGEGARGPAYDPAVHDPLLVPTTGFSGPNWGMDDLKWAVEQTRGGKAAVLCFHGVPDIEHSWVHTDPGVFKTYMDFLRDSGCTVIAMRGLGDYVDASNVPDDPNAKLEKAL
ncbi:MAG: polysaccharide deacetylase family protein [Planctomycetaceae bacterium]|nr:polysaccharide deacetylase family protein [Planctomycetaceae bacterium]